MAWCMICKPTSDLQQQQPPTTAKTTQTSCPSRLHGHPNFHQMATRKSGTRASCVHLHRLQTWTWASWAWWSATGPEQFCWLSTLFRPKETASREPVVWSSSPSWHPSSSSFPWFSSFFRDLCKPKNTISKLFEIKMHIVFIRLRIFQNKYIL